jgi:hypothetical protein
MLNHGIGCRIDPMRTQPLSGRATALSDNDTSAVVKCPYGDNIPQVGAARSRVRGWMWIVFRAMWITLEECG